MDQEPRRYSTPLGPATATVAPAETPRATLVLGHGAGGGIGATDLVALARDLPARGITVVRVEQPWRVAGRRVAGPPASLDRAWLSLVPQLAVEGPLLVGGRSAGARVACRTAGELAAVGCVALAFPLRPPGRPERSRVDELLAVAVPALVVQGEHDAFGGPDEFPQAPDRFTVHAVPGADHSFRTRGPHARASALAGLTDAVGGWVLGLVDAPPRRAGESRQRRRG